ncbi:MAG: choice-of-anchor D domain-containing protein [Acidobacteriia bacterium]|nr:choice-of-anchor D domain-containing protein [Terriglobia bacterium]
MSSNYKNLFPFAFILLVTVVAIAGCGGRGNLPASASSPPAPAAEAAHIVFSPAVLDFGPVEIGVQKTSTVTVSNRHGSKATISRITATGAGFSIISAPSFPLTLSAGESARFTVAFTPTSEGPASSSFTVTLAAPTFVAIVPMLGRGRIGSPVGQLSVNPSTMAFGSVALGSSKDLAGSLTATRSKVVISSASWNGAGYSLSGITFPVTVPEGQSIPFTVTFAPQKIAASAGSVSFFSDASTVSTQEALSGSGLQPAHSVDILWNASTSTVAGYNVYRGSQAGGPYARLNSSLLPALTFTDNSVQSGAVYFYVVTAVDASSQESVFSNESVATIPVP